MTNSNMNKASRDSLTISQKQLRLVEGFTHLSERAMAQLIQFGRSIALKPGALLERPEGFGNEVFHFVVKGQVTAVRSWAETEASDAVSKPKSKTTDEADREYLALFSPGDFFSDGFVDQAGEDDGSRIQCLAVTQSLLLGLDREHLDALMRENPEWAQELKRHNSLMRYQFHAQQQKVRKMVQDFFLRHGFSFASTLKVVQLDRCIDCGGCRKACASRFGASRLDSFGPRLGRLAFPTACRRCQDRRCLDVCKFDAIHWNEGQGEVQIEDACIGCGACARVCAHGAISMVQVPFTSADFPDPIPACDENGQTDVPGLYLAGPLAGGKGAPARKITGKIILEHIKQQQAATVDPKRVRLLIIGAGPVGLVLARSARKEGWRCLLVSEGDFTPSVHKEFGLREEGQGPVDLHENESVSKIAKLDNGKFFISSSQRDYRASYVVVVPPKGQFPLALLAHAGVRVLQPGTESMVAFAATLGTRKVADKCDRCAGYSDQACLTACPTGAIMEIEPQEIFIDSEHRREGETENFSGVPFLEGVREHQARKRGKRKFSWFWPVTFFAMLVIGLEAFLRRTMPESSFYYLWQSWIGGQEEVVFSSGKGFGHWLGYIGGSLMLLTLLYPLQSRLGWFQRWVTRNSWLTFHLWVGFTGAALTSYHTMMKLDRWAGIASVSMWLVILSGIFGRFLYSRVHSGMGLADFEKKSIDQEQRRLGQMVDLSVMEKIDSNEPDPDKPPGVGVMIYLEVRDRLRAWWLRHFGLRHIENKQVRREAANLMADRARNARARKYLARANKLLSYWNRVHLVITILMMVVSILHIVYALLYKAV